jgi:L-iditol 2-dehydrogenase
MLEPLSVGVYACEKSRVSLGSKVLVMGAGPVGLVTLLAAKASGASKVVIVDMVATRLKLAVQIGADLALTAEEATPETIVAAFGGLGPDVAIDCVGREETFRTAIYSLKPGGVCTLVGMAQNDMKVPMLDIVGRKEIDIKGVFRYRNTWPKTLALVASGRINVAPLITHRYTIEEAVEAFEHSMSMRDGAVKVMICMGAN